MAMKIDMKCQQIELLNIKHDALSKKNQRRINLKRSKLIQNLVKFREKYQTKMKKWNSLLRNDQLKDLNVSNNTSSSSEVELEVNQWNLEE